MNVVIILTLLPALALLPKADAVILHVRIRAGAAREGGSYRDRVQTFKDRFGRNFHVSGILEMSYRDVVD